MNDENGYLDQVRVENFFCIDELSIEHLGDKKEIYIVGENGDGKTILLLAILLALKGVRTVGEIVNFIKQNPRNNYRLDAVDNDGVMYRFLGKAPRRHPIANNVFAYGVHRNRNDSDKADKYGYLTLFEEDQYLENPIKWFQYLHHKETAGEKPPIRLKTALEMMKFLLNENVEINVTPDAVTFLERGTRVNFSQLADGYKSVIVWVCDLLARLSRVQPGTERITDFKGIVLLDEIELFLHPKWKYQVVRKLRQWFPGLQFIFTTHSSTIILGASKDAVFYKLYKENGVTHISQPISSISNLMLNGIITSPLFGLESARTPSFEEDIPEELDAHIFKEEIVDKVPGKKDKAFLLSLYKKRKINGADKYIQKEKPDKKSQTRLNSLLIEAGYKEPLDTSDDYLYYKIHKEIENRLRTAHHVTDDAIAEMVSEELDKYEKSLK